MDPAEENKAVLTGEIQHLSKILSRLSQLYGNLDLTERKTEVVDVPELLQKLYLTFKCRSQNYRFSLCLEKFSHGEKIKTDMFLLEECLRVLLENAFKHTPHRNEICLGAETRKEGLILFVRNNGIGIPKECHEKIFTPFFQVKKDYSSPGLGLSIARKFAESQDYSLSVVSDGEKQVQFSLAIPSIFFLS